MFRTPSPSVRDIHTPEYEAPSPSYSGGESPRADSPVFSLSPPRYRSRSGSPESAPSIPPADISFSPDGGHGGYADDASPSPARDYGDSGSEIEQLDNLSYGFSEDEAVDDEI